jgi:Phage portal protein, SPP1 Gp6-like.
MGWIDNIREKIKNKLQSWLNIMPAQQTAITIQESISFEVNIVKNRIWYIGNAGELSQLYRQLGEQHGDSFWAAVSTSGREIRKIHTGIPAIIVDTLTNIIMTNLDDIKVPDKRRDDWEKIRTENNFRDILETAVTECLYLGDGAFKISYDEAVSKFPIIEWYPADKIEVITERGRLKEVTFYTSYVHEKREYVLSEIYGYGYVKYELIKKDSGRKVEVNAIPELSELEDVGFDEAVCLAVPFRIFKNPREKGRGKSIYDGKTDDFDAVDEAWSQWMQALRDGRSTKYIPDKLLPRNPETGETLRPNPFDNSYIETDSDNSERAQNKMEVIQPQIPHDSYCATYVTALDLALQGIISPSTIGIDVKKLDNAESQREKEKTTLYTRGKIIDALQETIPLVINAAFKFLDIMRDTAPEETEATLDFGEYANPSFESQVETMGNAKTKGIVSNEALVDELYGDTKTEEWKEEEVKRLNIRDGIEEVEEPALNMDGVEMEVEGVAE